MQRAGFWLATVSWLSCCASTEGWAALDSSLVVDKIVVVGNETTKEHVILREMSLKVGGPLTADLIDYDQRRIYSLQLFNRVEIDYTVEESRATVYVRVSERWYIFPVPIVGFKYRDPKKLYYGAALLHQNFRGRNEKLMASFAFGFDRWISLAYQNPKITDDDDIFFSGAISYSHVQNQSISQGLYDQRVFAVNTTLGKRFGLYTTVQGSVGYDRWEVSDPMEGRTASADGVDRFLSFGLRYIYDSRDIREYASAGELALFSATKFGFGEPGVDIARYRVDLRGYRSIGDELVLCARAFGSFASGGVVPAYLRSYFGYDDRLRGYFYEVLEGEHSVGGSLEIRVPVFSPRYLKLSTPYLPPEFSLLRYGLSVGAFADAGKIWYRAEAFGTAPWRSGVGLGLHFLLPYSFVVRTEYALNNMGRGELLLDFGASF